MKPSPALDPNKNLSNDSFEEAVGEVLRQLGTLLAELLARTVGRGANTVDVQRELEIDKKLAWQVFRLATAEDALGEAANVPARRSFARLLAAGQERGVNEGLVGQLAGAFERFESLVAEHAGDRASLDAMIAGLSPERSDIFNLKLRQSLFEGQSQLWGYCSRMTSACMISHPGREAGTVDYAALTFLNDVQQIRRQVDLRMEAQNRRQAAPDTPYRTEPARYSWSILREFCRGPVLGISENQEENEDGVAVFRFADIGRKGMIDLAVLLDVQNTGRADEDGCSLTKCINAPAKAACMDLLVPTGWTNPATVRAQTFFSRNRQIDPGQFLPQDLLPTRDIATYCGRVRVDGQRSRSTHGIPGIPEVPRFAEMVRKVCQDRGWAETEFDLYRCRVEYPIVHSVVHVHVAGKNK